MTSWVLVDLGYMAIAGACGFVCWTAALSEKEFDSRFVEVALRIALTLGLLMTGAAAGGLFTEAWKLEGK